MKRTHFLGDTLVLGMAMHSSMRSDMLLPLNPAKPANGLGLFYCKDTGVYCIREADEVSFYALEAADDYVSILNLFTDAVRKSTP